MRAHAICLLLLSLLFLVSTPAASNVLERFVSLQEPSYEWHAYGQEQLADVTVYHLDVVSQEWQDRVWNHRLRILVPHNWQDSSVAILYLAGSGSGRQEILDLTKVAVLTGSPVGVLHDIPNHQLFDKVTEDEIISYTLTRYLETGDDTWPLLLPMTKGAVMAMNAFTEFWQDLSGQDSLDFIVAGASQQGWTTWLAAAVDKRIAAIAPIVYDNLNLAAQMRHQLASWGDYGDGLFHEYPLICQAETMASVLDPNILTQLDPYVHREEITVPKLIIQGTNDHYWPVDALNQYYADLSGDTYILYIPNNDHRIVDVGRLQYGIAALHRSVTNRQPLPLLRWDCQPSEDGIRLQVTSDPPRAIRFWTAQSPTRDFRQARWEILFEPETSSSDATSQIVTSLHLPTPDQGWQAVYAEATFDYDGLPLSLTTQIYLLASTE